MSVKPSVRATARVLLLAAAISLLAGCTVPALRPSPTPPPTPTPSLPPADESAYAFLQAWQRGDYPAMYSLLSRASQEQYPEEEFAAIYQGVVDEATVLAVLPRILAAYQPDTEAEVSFAVTFQTALVGDFEVQNEMRLAYDDGRWGVAWSPALILPQLSDETFVRLTTRAPSRGNIYDRNGLGLAVQGELVEVGVVPGRIEDEAALLAQLGAILGKSPADLQALYAEARPDWYVPLGIVSAETGQAYYDLLSSLPGVELREAWSRAYREEIIAPHVVGVVGPIPREEVDLWRAQGYSGDELVGQIGLERWGEPYLAGQRGGSLEILSDKGRQMAVLADRPSRESSSLYTTFDREFQKEVQEILGQRLGAIAVLEAKTGRVLALATYPLFDPNLFATGISDWQWQNLQADLRRPLVNRATQGTYPLGSVFKIVTMSAGMEAGGLTDASSFPLPGHVDRPGAGLAQGLLAAQRPRQYPPGQGPDGVVRHHLLPGGPVAQRRRPRRTARLCPQLWLWRTDRHRGRGGRRPGARPGLEDPDQGRGLGARRLGQPGHRPGRTVGHAARRLRRCWPPWATAAPSTAPRWWR